MEKNNAHNSENAPFVLDKASLNNPVVLYDTLMEKAKNSSDSSVLIADITSDELVEIVKASEAQRDQDIRRVGGFDNIHGGGGHWSTIIITSDNKSVPVSCCVLCTETEDLEFLASGPISPVQQEYWWDDNAERELKLTRARIKSLESNLVQ